MTKHHTETSTLGRLENLLHIAAEDGGRYLLGLHAYTQAMCGGSNPENAYKAAIAAAASNPDRHEKALNLLDHYIEYDTRVARDGEKIPLSARIGHRLVEFGGRKTRHQNEE